MKKIILISFFIGLISNSYGQAIPISGNGYHYYGPNTNWGEYLKVGGNGRETTKASVVATNGNLHLDSKDGKATYLNHYSKGDTYLNTQGGNVGIGTSTPNAKLDIFGANSNTTNLILAANYVDKYRWRFNTIDRGAAIDLDFTASDSQDSEEIVLKLTRSSSGRPEFQLHNNAIVANNGNVGIGMATPSEKLHVKGTIKSHKLLLLDPNNASNWNSLWQSGFYQGFNATNAPEPNQWFWGINMNHSSNSAEYRYNGQIAIRNNSISPRMYFRSTKVDGTGTWTRVVHSEGTQYIKGSLGIGTTTPDAKLTVKGKIHAEEVKIDLSVPAPDYVFKKDYDLLTIAQVQQHIKEKGHLPNIPSAKILETEGVDLGLMNMKLLEKIEELTLYTIDQEKQLQQQQIANQKLENKNDELEARLVKIEKLLVKE